MTDEDVYAAETDSDTDNEIDRPCRATPARSSQLTSIVKQTPGEKLTFSALVRLNQTFKATKGLYSVLQKGKSAGTILAEEPHFLKFFL